MAKTAKIKPHDIGNSLILYKSVESSNKKSGWTEVFVAEATCRNCKLKRSASAPYKDKNNKKGAITLGELSYKFSQINCRLLLQTTPPI